MPQLATLPRASRLERTAFVLALVPIGLGGGVYLSRALRDNWAGQLWPGAAPMGAVECAAFFLLGVGLVGRLIHVSQLRLLGLAVVAAGVWTLVEAHGPAAALQGFDLEQQFGTTRMASITACCLVLAGAVTLLRSGRHRLLAEAVAGSILAAVACSTFMGYEADMPAVYTWGGIVPMAPGTAASMLGVGLAIVALAWRDSSRAKQGPPAWIPAPAVIAGATLAFTLWAGLRDREQRVLDTQTTESVFSLARASSAAIDQERSGLERLAQNWSDPAVPRPAAWDADAAAQMAKSQPLGCVALAAVDAGGRTRWVYPTAENEALIAFDHRTVDARREAMARSRQRLLESPREGLQPAVSSTLDVRGRKHGGFAIYAPIVRDGKLLGWLEGEYLYANLVRGLIEDDLKLADDYRVVVLIGLDPVYAGGGIDPAAGTRYTVDRTITVFERHFHIALTPADPQRLHDLKSLPDFALVAGLGLTALLGLSVHLARRSRSGQRAAEESNRLLLTENEERRRVESRLKLSDERLRLALDSTEIGIVERNVAAGRAFYSSGLWVMFGYDPASMAPSPAAWKDIIHPDDAGSYQARLDAQLEGQTAFVEMEYRVRNAAGGWRWVYTRSKVVATDNKGRAVRLLGTVQDVTSRVETEHQLRRAKAEADAASRAKSEFLASMSHEIRTPMNGIIGMTSLMMDTPLNEEQQDYLNTIRSSSEALLTIVNDILDFSKIESGKMDIEKRPFGLSLCLEETLELFAAPASEKGIELVYRVEPDVPDWIEGDVTRLWQVITNLINNAVKFTTSGAIAVEVRLGGALPDGRLIVEFTVRDTGMGIPPDRMGRLFKAFSQVDSSTTRRFGGTGLGLAICERLCLLMGGTIRVESTVGVGSAFIFTIATAAAEIPADLDLTPPLPGALREGWVLAIEPHPLLRARFEDVLAAWGVRCEAAASNEAAIELAAKVGRPPALLVMSEAKQAAAPMWTCPTVLLVPFGTAAGARPGAAPAEAVVRPVKNSALFQAIVKVFSGEAAHKRNASPGAQRLLGQEIPLKVLLAEDNPVNQKVALGLLERLGYKADLAPNGAEAVKMADQTSYDLVLMDLQMPEMDGLEASRMIRRRHGSTKPKIVALTANAMQGDKELCLSAGMDDYVVKPVKLADVAAAIRRHFVP